LQRDRPRWRDLGCGLQSSLASIKETSRRDRFAISY
jgi:hypothetical protein